MVELLIAIGALVLTRLLFVLVAFLVGCVVCFFYKRDDEW